MTKRADKKLLKINLQINQDVQLKVYYALNALNLGLVST